MKKTKLLKVATVAMAVAMGATAMMGCGATNYAENNTEYVIGCSGPLTGDAAVYGLAVQKSAQMAVEEINAAGGIDGVNVKFVMKDDQCGTTLIASNFAELYENQGMQVSLGTVTSGSCLAYKPYAKDENVFCLTPSATNDEVPGDTVYQMCFSDSSQGKYAAQYLKTNYSGKTVGIFYNNSDAYSTGIYNTFVAEFGASNVVATATFTNDTASDFSAQVQTLKECDIIFMPIYYTPASLFIRQANGETKASAMYFGCDGFDGIDSVSGFDVNEYSQEISYLSHFNVNEAGATETFVTAFKTKYGADTQYLNQFGASAYDCVYAIVAAMKQAKTAGKNVAPTTSASDMCDILKEVFSNGFTYSGVTGTNITWNADNTVNKAAKKFVVNPDRVTA